MNYFPSYSTRYTQDGASDIFFFSKHDLNPISWIIQGDKARAFKLCPEKFAVDQDILDALEDSDEDEEEKTDRGLSGDRWPPDAPPIGKPDNTTITSKIFSPTDAPPMYKDDKPDNKQDVSIGAEELANVNVLTVFHVLALAIS